MSKITSQLKPVFFALVGFFAAVGLLSLSHIGPASAQSPGVNLAQLVATVNSLQSTVANQGKAITTLQNTVSGQASEISDLNSVISFQSSQITNLKTLTAPLSLSSDPSAGGTNTLLTITGVNVQIVNGMSKTETQNGLGNLIVGYNEKDPNFSQARGGSHNLVVGKGNNYLSYGGLIAGQSNLIEAPYASISGGSLNVAKSSYASVSGGSGNDAKADYASISGGYQNVAEGNAYTSVSGGYQNVAFGEWASVSGGYQNIAGGEEASVCGGYLNRANGNFNTVTGGEFNKTGGIATSISGGASRNQSTNDGWTAGSDSPNSSDYIGDFRSP